ncbi:hypothetical protein QF006_000698 [Pantoea agglomerans]|nr:hypothetical protein [Pantoea agglomerans]
MSKYILGLVKVLGIATTILTFLNELITFIEKVQSYLHVVPHYILKRNLFCNGHVEA